MISFSSSFVSQDPQRVCPGIAVKEEEGLHNHTPFAIHRNDPNLNNHCLYRYQVEKLVGAMGTNRILFHCPVIFQQTKKNDSH